MTKKITKHILLIVLFCIISFFLYIKFKTYSYTVNYVVDKYKIEESYNKETKKYTFLINDNSIVYPYNFENKYIRNKELINNIKIYKNEEEICILPISSDLDFYPLCNKDNIIKTCNLSNIEINDYKYKKYNKDNIKHNKLNINYLNDAKFLLYNYKGFYYINENNIEEIKIFNNDLYKIDLIYELNEFLIIPNYNEEYYFTKIFIINMDNGKVKEIKLDNEISFNSVFLGDYKNNIYLLDKKEEKEYKINIKKLKVEEIDFKILKDNKLVSIKYKDIVNNNLVFDNKKELSYKIIDNKLYQIINNYKVLISNKEVNKIIKESNNTIYYLSNDNLYMYNNIYGEVLLINNFEWNFNNTNMIYLYK